MRIRIVNDTHYVCSGDNPLAFINEEVDPSPRLSEDAKRFWKKWGLYACDGAVVATEAGKVVGFFRYFTHGKGGAITTAGTWVDPRYRNQGLALRLWKPVMTQKNLKTVYFVTVSRGGRRLVAAAARIYPRIRFRSP